MYKQNKDELNDKEGIEILGLYCIMTSTDTDMETRDSSAGVNTRTSEGLVLT